MEPAPSLFTTILTSCPSLYSLTFSGTLDTAADEDVAPRHDSLTFLSLGSMGVPASMVTHALREGSWPALDMLEATRGGRWKPRQLARVEALCQESGITFFSR